AAAFRSAATGEKWRRIPEPGQASDYQKLGVALLSGSTLTLGACASVPLFAFQPTQADSYRIERTTTTMCTSYYVIAPRVITIATPQHASEPAPVIKQRF